MSGLLNVLLPALHVLVYVVAGAIAAVAWKRDKRAALFVIVGCGVLLVSYGVGYAGGYAHAALDDVVPGQWTVFVVLNSLASVLTAAGWGLILVALFLGARTRRALGSPPQPVPAQAWQAGPGPYGPPPQGPQPPYPPQQPYGPPPNPYGR